MLDSFKIATIEVNEAQVFTRYSGDGPPVLLLHGFPETHLMWRDVAPELVRDFTVVCADLRGYGESSCPASDPDHLAYSKRTMAKDMVQVMEQLGFTDFRVVGHDRGGRVAYRMALDYPDRVGRLAVLDIVPSAEVWDRADSRFALGFWPWSLLAQPAPLPERLLTSAAEAIIDNALNEWGSRVDVFPNALRELYIEALRDPEHAHAICEEYRAAATIDREHDKQSLAKGERIVCPLFILWGEGGALDTWYVDEGGPLQIWKAWADRIEGRPIKGGHFFPEERPSETAEALREFLLGN